MRMTARLSAGDLRGPFAEFRRRAEQRLERAALIATDRASRDALSKLRSSMASAGLGRLGNAIGATSDLREGSRVKRSPGGGFSVSGVLFIRSKSPRTIGTLESYLEGSEIRPVRSRLLWVPTDAILRLAGGRDQRQRVTPGNWAALGLDSRIGPLVYVKAKGGFPLLIVRNVGVAISGRLGSARALTKTGRARKGQTQVPAVVAFVGIPRTSRAARVNAAEIVRAASESLPSLFATAMGSR